MMEQLFEGAVIIGDKGFQGRKNLKIITINSIHPENESAFLKVRCTVENVIMKGRKWKALDDRQRKPVHKLEEALIYHHKRVSVIFCLVNLFDIPIRKYNA